jgi:hypothetical protein
MVAIANFLPQQRFISFISSFIRHLEEKLQKFQRRQATTDSRRPHKQVGRGNALFCHRLL